MQRRAVQFVSTLGAALAVAAASATPARAQGVPFAPPPAGGPASPAGNMFANSYANPFLNPYAAALSQQPMDTGTMALYFLAARQAGGGIGTGKLSGTRPGPAAAGREIASTDAPRPSGPNVPGALASRYFNRTTPVYQGTKRYYNRQPRSFPSAGQSR